MSAVISPDGKYRYRLDRRWGPGPTLLWIMLNPSTADATENDATIRSCIRLSQSWGYGGLTVGNKYAIRSTDPGILRIVSAEEARGPENDKYLVDMALEAKHIVCAWGNPGGRDTPRNLVGPFFCCGRTKIGAPKHPLYLPSTTVLEAYP